MMYLYVTFKHRVLQENLNSSLFAGCIMPNEKLKVVGPTTFSVTEHKEKFVGKLIVSPFRAIERGLKELVASRSCLTDSLNPNQVKTNFCNISKLKNQKLTKKNRTLFSLGKILTSVTKNLKYQ